MKHKLIQFRISKLKYLITLEMFGFDSCQNHGAFQILSPKSLIELKKVMCLKSMICKAFEGFILLF